jgi:RNA polymerase sigma factor (sigma-70 family)
MAYAVSGWASAQGGDPAFDRLFLQEYATVAGIAYKLIGDRDEAEDVAQEAFCSFYRNHDPNSPYAAPWLYRAAAHIALNSIRGKKRRSTRELVVEEARQRHVETDDPQRLLETEERRREVREALARLPEKSATVLALRYSGLSYVEVASALGVKVGQIGTLLRRAEAALKKEMTHATH